MTHKLNQIHLMKLFVAIVQNNSFTAASKQLNITATKASKDINYLESSLDCKLLHRSTRSINVTDAGEMYYKSVLEILEMHSEMIDKLKMIKNTICGELRITAPALWGELVLSPIIIKFKKRYPEVKFIANLTNDTIDIYKDNIHIAFRSTDLKNEPYYSKHIISDEFVMCASSSYISSHLPISSPQDLSSHLFITLIKQNTQFERIDFMYKGQSIKQHIKGDLMFNNKQVIYQAIKAGLGIAVLPKYLIAKELESGNLIEILQAYKVKGSNFYALYTQRRKDSILVNHFIDFVCNQVSVSRNK